MNYAIGDTLSLWFLAAPTTPRLIGALNLVRNARGVSLAYAPSWRQQGFALSEDLPLQGPSEYLPAETDCAVGAVDDARPDRWGERIIRYVERPPRLSILDYLYFAGDERFGALGVSTSAERYCPHDRGPLPRFARASEVEAIVQKVLANEPLQEIERRLISPGGTMGGARPKALLSFNDESWVVKFAAGDPIDVPLIEHAAMTLAATAGIRVAKTKIIRTTLGHALAVQRFDRARGTRIHVLSAHVVLRAASERYGYPELAQVLRRRGSTERGANTRDMHELFRRMVFNILLDNTDDHEKNHAVLQDANGLYRLAPAYDVLPSGQALGVQQMRVGAHNHDSTLENARSMAALFALTPAQTTREIRRVTKAVSGWRAHFHACGVTKNDVTLLADQIDRPFLKQQRDDV